jgi:SAM-dependent methyltransferase
VGFAEKFGASLGVKVVGMDYSAEPLEGARKLAAERGLTDHCSFEQGDVYKLRWPDATFTAAHAHQVLMHLPDPVAALKEIKRVLKPAGSGAVLALREGDIGSTAIHPLSHGLAQWKELWSRVGRAAGGEPDAGRRLKEWALGAGFSEESMEFTAGTFCYSTPAERAWWGELWAVRTADVTHSSWAAQAIKDGHATQSELNAIALCWRVWAKIPGATFIMPHGQLLIRI